MKKLLLATAVALFGASAANASQLFDVWYQGDFSCKLAGSRDMLTLSFKHDLQTLAVTAKARLSSWSGNVKGTNFYRKGDYLHFYVPVAGGQANIQLQRKHRGFKRRVTYTGKYVYNGKSWQLTCTR